jgi:hypothetical protein
MALQQLSEVKAEASGPANSSLHDVLARIGPLPLEALLLGIASDNLPVLLNLYDPHPGPLLVAADAGSDKTTFLRTLAQSVALTHRSSNVQFGVVTNYPDEWEVVRPAPHCSGVFPVGHKSTQEFMQSLSSWAHSNKNTHQCVLLMVDDLESVASLDLETVQHFRWLLLRGPARRVWPIITLNAPRYGQVISWLQNFRTRIFGRIANGRVAEALGGDKAAALDQLEGRLRFCMRERDKWIRFWLPSF